jgi:hypothetical protein
MPIAICCGELDGAGGEGAREREGAGDVDGAGEGWICWACCCAFCWTACCCVACLAAAVARRSALRRAAARRAAASWAATARLCCRRWTDWVLENKTCEASASLPPSRRLAPACWAELALPAVSESAVDTPGAVAGQSATTPAAAAAVTTVEPVVTIVIFEGLLCMGVLRRRCVGDKMCPWLGARRALASTRGALPRRRECRGGQRRTDVTRVRATSCSVQPSRTLGAVGHPDCRHSYRSDAGTCLESV